MIIVRSQWAHYNFSRTIVQELVVLVVSAFGEVKIWADVNVNNLLNHNMCSNIATKKNHQLTMFPGVAMPRQVPLNIIPLLQQAQTWPNTRTLTSIANTGASYQGEYGELLMWYFAIFSGFKISKHNMSIDVAPILLLGLRTWRITISQSSLVCLTFRLRGIWK